MKKALMIAAILSCLLLSLCACAGDSEIQDTSDSHVSEATESTGDTEGGNTESQSENQSENQSESQSESQSAESESLGETDGGEQSSDSTGEETESAETDSETETETETETEDEYAKTIEYANSIAGGVNATYNPNRSMATVTNLHAKITYPLANSLPSGKVCSSSGAEYAAVVKPFVKNKDGYVFYESESDTKERMNIYRLGSYYYEIHMLDGHFNTYKVLDSVSIDLSTYTSCNMIDSINYEDGILSYRVTNPADPYIYGTMLSIDTQKYDAIEITIATTASTHGRLYIAAGSYPGPNGKQNEGFAIKNDGEFHTYIVPISHLEDYTGMLTRVRIDVGSAEGEIIKISSLKAVKLAATAPAVKLDNTFHLYSDKLNQVIRLVASKSVADLASFGYTTSIPKDRVNAVIIKDKNGIHTSLEGVDFDSAEYFAFDIDGAGIYGHILLPTYTSGRLTVTLDGESYLITQEFTLDGKLTLKTGDQLRMGYRLYTDETHSFDGFLFAAECERNPQILVSVGSDADGAEYVGYDVYRGAYRFTVNSTNFSHAYNNPYTRYTVHADFSGIDHDRPIYVYTYSTSGQLESGALISSEGMMLPVPLEVCKNFKGENEEPFYDKGDSAYGEIILPLVVRANDTTSVSIVNLYQNWGNFPLKQISSIQFIAPYYHISVGTTETNCIAPYFVYGKDHWTLPDFRAMSAPLWPTQPQHTSIGRLYFLEYTTSDGNSYASESVSNKITSYGPTYCDIDMNYISDDGRIKAYYRHMEMPHTDENRTYYELVLEVQDTIEINDFKNDFSFFSFDGRSYLFKKLGYLDENNECVITDANMTETPNYITLGNNSPYISYFDGNETSNLTAYVNFALVVKSYSFTVGGKSFDGNPILRDVYKDGLNRMSLTLDLGKVTLQKGDRFVINMILLPWGDPSAENDDNVRRVRQDSCIAPYTVAASRGSVIEDVYLPRVMAEDGVAEFTLSGGDNNCVVRIYGFEDYNGITVSTLADGNWVEYKLNSEKCTFDGYTVYKEEDGSYSYAFVVNMGENEQSFRVTGK